jgi:hypothetical protein
MSEKPRPVKPVITKAHIFEAKPEPEGDVEKTFPSLVKTDRIHRWGHAFEPRPQVWTEVHSGHVFKDSDGNDYVIDASARAGTWRAYRLVDVVELDDDNTPLTEA